MRAHELVTPRPVEFSLHHAADRRCVTRQRVPDVIIFFANVDDRVATERSHIVRLSPTCGVKGSAVEHHRVVATSDDRCFKRREIRVAQIQQFGQ